MAVGIESQLINMIGTGGASAGSLAITLAVYKLINKWIDKRSSNGNGNGKKPLTRDNVQLMIVENNTKFYGKLDDLGTKMDVNKKDLSDSIGKIHTRIDSILLKR